MVRIANEKDIKQIINILTEAFDMTENDCIKMLEMIKPCDNTFIFEVNGEILSLASAIPFRVNTKTGRYVYAVATRPSDRKKGIAAELLRYVIDYFKDEDVIMLKPASKELFNYYEKVGFERQINADVIEYVKNISVTTMELCSFDVYVKEREKYNKFKFPDNVQNYYVSAYGYKSAVSCNAVGLYRISNNICYIDEIYGNGAENLIQCILNTEMLEKAVATQRGSKPFALAHFYDKVFDIDFRIPME